MSSDSTPAPAPTGWRAVIAPYLPTLTSVMTATAAVLVGALLHWLGAPPATVEKVTEVLVKGEAERLGVNPVGWSPDHDAESRDVPTFRTFADTPAGQFAGELPKSVFLWQAETKLTGQPTPLKDQNPTGSCVGFGTTTAIERSLAADVAQRNGDPGEFAHFSEEVTYAGSKVQGARSLGASVSRDDGSAGVFAQKWVTQVGGMVPKAAYGQLDLTTYSAARARAWNLSGCPAELLAVARKYPVKSAAKVTSWQQAKQALASGYGIAGCASWSFARQRNADGVASATREGWNHCMAIDGYYTDGAREYGHVENSWSTIPGVGPYHTGPTGWGNPTTAGFWADCAAVERALKQGDSYAYSGATGFAAKKLPLDWMIRNKPRRAPLDLFARGEFALAP
jgi:hypothetical protein